MALSGHRRKGLRQRFAERQDGRCCYCRRLFTPTGKTQATLEHLRARMDGGRDIVANLAAACLHCNQHRGRQMVRDRLKDVAARAARALQISPASGLDGSA